MNIQLTPLEARVIGSLMEKAVTTPDQYPLSLNALVSACNQKSNRDPVMELDERAVQDALDALGRKHFVLERSGFGSRVPKYQHRFCNTGFGSLELSALEAAIVCELLLRGPQTPGELRGRASRMAPVQDVGEVESALARLAAREDGPFVVRLAREAGKRESRYAHLFSGPVEGGSAEIDEPAQSPVENAAAARDPSPSLRERVESLEERVLQLEREIERLTRNA